MKVERNTCRIQGNVLAKIAVLVLIPKRKFPPLLYTVLVLLTLIFVLFREFRGFSSWQFFSMHTMVSSIDP